MEQRERKQGQFIMDPKVDFAFKLLFGDERRKGLLIALLSSVLKIPKADFSDLELLNTELLPEYAGDRKGILDVRARFMNGKQIDIEIQMQKIPGMLKRVMFYWSKMYVSQLQKGQNFHEMKECIVISIVDYTQFDDERYARKLIITDEETGKQATDVLELHFIELKKLHTQKTDLDQADPLIQWMTFLKCEDWSEMEMILNNNEDIQKAYEELERLSLDPNAKMLYEAREKELLDSLAREAGKYAEGFEAGKEDGKELGIEIGNKQGEEKAHKKIAESLYSQGYDIETIGRLIEKDIKTVRAYLGN